MDIEPSGTSHLHIPFQPHIGLTSTGTRVKPDGMLLYVAEASYEPGTSPLSSWIPIRGYDVGDCEGAHLKDKHEAQGVSANSKSTSEGPLDLFQRCVNITV